MDRLTQVPHSVEAEQSVLGSMLVDPECIAEVVTHLSPDDFYVETNRRIYESVMTLSNRYGQIDQVTVIDTMKKSGAVDGDVIKYLAELIDSTPTAANVMSYVKILHDQTTLRKLLDASGRLSEMILGGGNAADALEEAERTIFSIRKERSVNTLVRAGQVLAGVYNTIRERGRQDSKITGTTTGLADLDRQISGMNDSEMVVIAARPGMGKTSLALNIGLSAATSNPEKAVVIFSLEMSAEQLGFRLLSSVSLVDHQRMTVGKVTTDEWERISKGVAIIAQTRMYMDDTAGQTVADIRAKCRRVEGLGLVIIDYLGLLSGTGERTSGKENRQQVVSDMSRSIKLMAKELNVPVLCLCQMNRAIETRSGKNRPKLSDLRDSGSIEQDADVVLFLNRETESEENDRGVECIVAKNRHGETGTVHLEWLPDFTLFRNMDYVDQEDPF